jgi:predicted ATP-binding protein involved in virulence
MKVKKLILKNFRGFEDESFEFSNHFTVIIGDNGTGKSAILDALAIGVGSFFLGIDGVSNRHINSDEVRVVKYEQVDSTTLEQQFPVGVSCEGVVNGQAISWERSIRRKNGRTTWKDAASISSSAQELQEGVQKGQDVLLPLVAYYSTGRLWLQKREKPVEPAKPGSRMRGYADCLEPESNIKMLVRWFKTMTFASLQKGKTLAGLEAVKAAVANCMENWNDIHYDVLEDELLVTFRDGRVLPFRMLSDGIRNMVAMVQDMAYRAVILNPHLGKQAINTPGVVLVDEIDLHLHPKWQRHIVSDLRNAFPNIQFIATTHSPFIIQSMWPGEVIDLNENEGQYYGKSIEDITETVLGVDHVQRSERFVKMMEAAKDYYRVLEQAKRADADEVMVLKRKLDELIAPFSDDVAYYTFLEMERTAAALGGTKA